MLNYHDVKGDHRGQLVAIESHKDIPFEIKRIFYIYGTDNNVVRAQHAHHSTIQYLICVNGSCSVTLDDGYCKKTYELDRPYIGLLKKEMVWVEIHHFSHDSILMVLANNMYLKEDYITDYGEFMRLVSK